jgi:Ca2+-binding EF-hand superfamily protein
MSELDALVAQVHAKYDAGSKGHLTQGELKQLLDDVSAGIGFKGGVKESQVQAVMAVVDSNNDGEIDLDELRDNLDKINGLLDFNFNPTFLKKVL